MFWVLQLGQGGRGDVTPQSRSTWHLCPKAPRLQLTDKQANKQGPKKHQAPFAFRHKEKQYNRIGFTHQCLYIYTAFTFTCISKWSNSQPSTFCSSGLIPSNRLFLSELLWSLKAWIPSHSRKPSDAYNGCFGSPIMSISDKGHRFYRYTLLLLPYYH